MTVFSRRFGAKPLVSLSSPGAEIAQVLISQNHNVLLVNIPRSEFRSPALTTLPQLPNTKQHVDTFSSPERYYEDP